MDTVRRNIPDWLDVKVLIGTMPSLVVMLITLGVTWESLNSRIGILESASAASSTRAALYQPRLEAMERANGIEDERLKNMTESLQEARKTNTELLLRVGRMGEDIAGIKARLDLPIAEVKRR